MRNKWLCRTFNLLVNFHFHPPMPSRPCIVFRIRYDMNGFDIGLYSSMAVQRKSIPWWRSQSGYKVCTYHFGWFCFGIHFQNTIPLISDVISCCVAASIPPLIPSRRPPTVSSSTPPPFVVCLFTPFSVLFSFTTMKLVRKVLSLLLESNDDPHCRSRVGDGAGVAVAGNIRHKKRLKRIQK